jgi:hypothetical protein
MEVVIGGWGQLYNENLHNFLLSVADIQFCVSPSLLISLWPRSYGIILNKCMLRNDVFESFFVVSNYVITVHANVLF